MLEASLLPGSGHQGGPSLLLGAGPRGVHRESKRKHVMLQIAWDEYIAQHLTGSLAEEQCPPRIVSM